MTQSTDITQQLPLTWPGYIAGEPVQTDDKLEVRYPWDGSLTGTGKWTTLVAPAAKWTLAQTPFPWRFDANGDGVLELEECSVTIHY